MENPNATWNDFSTQIIQRDVSYQVSSNCLNDEEQTKVQLASLGQKIKNLRSELQEHRVNALENSRQPYRYRKGRQNATTFLLPHQRTHSKLVSQKNAGRRKTTSALRCPSKRMLLLYGTEELATLTINPNTVKTGTGLRIRMMVTTQL